MSAALSKNEADMLTKGREPAAKSSGKEKKNEIKEFTLLWKPQFA